MRDLLNILRGVVQDGLSHIGQDKELLKHEQKKRQKIIIRRLRELSAPYTYYCEVGDHSWSWETTNGAEPPGKDGEDIICPEHGCALSL